MARSNCSGRNQRTPAGRAFGAALLVALARSLAAQQVPEGFQAELIYQTPEVKHPSVVTCDTAGNLFVGEDPMDMRGPTTKEFDRVLFVRWDRAGGRPRKTVFCEGLSAVFGLVWLEDRLCVLHAPHYSVFRDTDGDGVADERQDLAEGFGPAAGVYGFNDHIVSGMQLGLDGRLYVSVGDKGIQRAVGADGSTMALEGGGIVSLRPDGTQLEVVTSGTRNHLDVALDSFDRMFTYDNTDDGLGWWTRFTHQVPSGYYGYPFDYLSHPARHLPRVSEHGGGSPTGGACYRGGVWPAEFRDNAFFCEWGKGRVQRFSLQSAGATFTAAISDFMTPDGTGDFRPQDLCFSPDGQYLYVADWNFNGWTQPAERGRLYRVRYTGPGAATPPAPPSASAPVEDQIAALAHPNFDVRLTAQRRLAPLGQTAAGALDGLLATDVPAVARVHAVWAQAALAETLAGYDPVPRWLTVADEWEPEVRAQVARVLGRRREARGRDWLVAHLAAGPQADASPEVRLWVAIALGELADRSTAVPLARALGDGDSTVRFVVMQALRRLEAWPELREPLAAASIDVQRALLLALSGQYDPEAVELLAWAAENLALAELRAAAVTALAEVELEAEPYTSGWWGTQPARVGPARPKEREWACTSLVRQAVERACADGDGAVRRAALRAANGMRLVSAAVHSRRLAAEDADRDVRLEALRLLGAGGDAESIALLAEVAQREAGDEDVCRAAVEALTAIRAPEAAAQIQQLLVAAEERPYLARAGLVAAEALRIEGAREVVQRYLAHRETSVRGEAARCWVTLAGAEGVEWLIPLLSDAEPAVRVAVLEAVRPLRSPAVVPTVLAMVGDPATRFSAILTLAAVADRRALSVYLQGLVDKNADLRAASRAALSSIRGQVAEELLTLAAREELTSEVRREVASLYSSPAAIHHWQIAGTWDKAHRPEFDAASAPMADGMHSPDGTLAWRTLSSDHPQGRVTLKDLFARDSNCWAVAYHAFESSFEGRRRALLGSDDQAQLWVNGEQVYEFLGDRGWGPDQAEVELPVRAGTNHVWLLTGNSGGPWEFSLQVLEHDPRFSELARALPPAKEPAAYRDHALAQRGDRARGQRLFEDQQGVACVKCHAVAGQGGKVGPDLLGVGGKYPRDELIRSVLEPSSRILSGYEVTIVNTTDGRTLEGIVVQRRADRLDLVDVQGKRVAIPKRDIEEEVRSQLSLMPSGLKDGLTLDDFADIIAYLESL